jgi:hypothetical protein
LHFLWSLCRVIEALAQTLCACNGTWSFSIVFYSNFSSGVNWIFSRPW